MKKIKLLLLSALVSMAVSAFGADTISVGNLKYTVQYNDYYNDVVYAVGLSASGKAASNLALDIPSTITYAGVKYIVRKIDSNAFENATNLTSVTINYVPTDFQVINAYAFRGCSNITYVRIPSSMTYIGSYAFLGCTKLKRVFMACTEPANVDVKNNTFPNNSGMELYVPKTEGREIVDKYDKLAAYVQFSSIKASSDAYDFMFADGAQMCVTKAPTATIPGEVTMVGYSKSGSSAKDGAFVPACTGTSTGTYGSNGYRYHFVAIADRACKDNTDLKSIDLSKLTKLHTIGTDAFSSCSNLAEANIDCVSLENIKSYAFASTALKSIHIPANVNYMYSDAFDTSFDLTSITVDKANTTYSSYNDMLYNKGQTTLYRCPAGRQGDLLDTNADFPAQLEILANSAFIQCKNLNKVFLPNKVSEIGPNAFRSSGIKFVKLPSSVTDVKGSAFSYCESLTEIECKGMTPPMLTGTSTTFSEVTYNQATLRVPAAALNVYKAHEVWGKFLHIEGVDDGLKGDVNADGIVNVSDVTALVNKILGTADYSDSVCDIDGNGTVNVSDVTALVNLILG